MNQNSFQKNPFLQGKTGSTIGKHSKFSNYDQLGRKTVEEVKKDIEYNHFQDKIDSNRKTELTQQTNNVPDFKSRVDMLKKVNRG